MKFIRRWGLMRNTQPESIQEHSQRVATIAHALAVIRNRLFGGSISPERTATLGLFHDVSEVITGDLPTPIKHFNPKIKDAYREIEKLAGTRLYNMFPEDIKKDYEALFFRRPEDAEHWELVGAADKICAYLKCLEEITAGNAEFSKAEKTLKKQLDELDMPEVGYFMDTFAPSFSLTLDELD